VSDQNEAIVRRALSHLNEAGEPDWDLYDADVVWMTRSDGPALYTYRGLDGLRRGNASLRTVWADLSGEVLEIVGTGDTLVAVIRWHLRSHSGVELEVVEGWANWLRDGKIVRVEQHGSKEEALAAAGLAE
jgi:ketosteroid isomerase-like protein